MAKGSAFERLVCKHQSQWWDPAAEDVLFWPTAGSGGRATVRAKSGRKTTQTHCGDICALDERGAPLTKLVTWELIMWLRPRDATRVARSAETIGRANLRGIDGRIYVSQDVD